MEKKTLFIAVTTQKGGVGKSATTTVTASYLHTLKGYNVAVIDCDYPQHSIYDMRDREIDIINNDEHYKRMAFNLFNKLGKKAYSIVRSSLDNALTEAQQLMQDEDLDIIFFDMPGSLNTNGVLTLLSKMDYIFSPISADRLVTESTLQFVSMFNDNIVTTGKAKVKEMYLFWTMVDGREKTKLYDRYENVIKDLGLNLMNTFLPDSKKYRREISSDRKAIFRSTIFPIDKTMIKNSNIPEFIDEICSIINFK